MERGKAELLQLAIFLVIFAGQVFLINRYYPRNDMVGVAIFAVVAVLSAIAAVGHFLEWRKAVPKKQGSGINPKAGKN